MTRPGAGHRFWLPLTFLGPTKSVGVEKHRASRRACSPPASTRIYRLRDKRVDTNHLCTTDRGIRDVMGGPRAPGRALRTGGYCHVRAATVIATSDDANVLSLAVQVSGACGGKWGPRRSKPSYSISLSARESTEGGKLIPSAFAAFRFSASSNLVGCAMGRSPGFAPLRILST